MALRRGLSGELRTSMQNIDDQSATFLYPTTAAAGAASDWAAAQRHGYRQVPHEILSNTDWILLASLLDRIFFIVYFIINVTSASVIFHRAIP